MASIVTQKVILDASQYRAETKKLSGDTRKETDKVNGALNESGNAVRDFNDRVKNNTDKSSKSFNDLFKGIKGGLGALSLAGLGIAAGAAIAKNIKEGSDLTDVVNRATVRTGGNEFERAQFRNQVLGVSTATNVDEDQVAAAAENALAFGASSKEAVKFAEVIAKTSKVFEDLDPASFSEQIARDLRGRGEEVTAENARKSIESLIVGVRSGLVDIDTAFKEVSALPGRVQERAGLSQRALVNLFGGAQGVKADPSIVNEAIRSLIKATDNLESRAAVQGVLGTSLRDEKGNFQLSTKNLDEIAKNLKGIGDEVTQRAVLETLPGLTPDAVEGLLALVKDRASFQQEREKTGRDEVTIVKAFERSTDGFLEKVSKFFNAFGNEFKKDKKFEAQFGRSGQRIGLSAQQVEAAKTQKSTLALPGDRPREDTPTRKQQDRKPAALSNQQNVNVKIEVDSVDPGFIATPKSTELSRDPGGL